MPDKPTDAASPEPREVATIQADRQVCKVRYSPSGAWLFAGDYQAALRRWDLSGEEAQEAPPLEGHHGWLDAVEFAPEGSPGPQLFTADSWGQLCAWSNVEAAPKVAWRHEQAHDGWIRSLAVSEDGTLLATAGRDQRVRVWRAKDGEMLAELSGHEHEVFSVGVHPDNKSVVSGDLMGTLKHWNFSDGKLVREVVLKRMHFYDRIQDVAGLRILRFHDGGKTLVCAGSDPTRAGRSFGLPTLRLLDWETLEEKKVFHLGPDKDGYVFDLTWNPAGYFMLVTSGPPGAGKFHLLRPEDDEPFYTNSSMFNCHSLAAYLPSRRVAVSSTNRGSQGNGAVLDTEGNYRGNVSPLAIFELPESA